MSGIIGKKNSTLKKKTVKESKLLETGVKNLKFWHEASEGDTVIPFGSLNMPGEISSLGYSNPSGADILGANLAFFKENVSVHSYLNGELLEGTFVVKNNQIQLLNYTAEEGEVFRVTTTNNVVTENTIVDGRVITATGTLTAGDQEFVVGEIFKTNAYPTEQLGEVLVFVDGEVQYRNVGNAAADPAADGNYQEVHATNGYGSVIKFNEPYIEDKPIIVISRALIAERPNLSMMQFIEVLGGQLDAVISTVAALAGVDESEFQTAPNQIDLKAFGDQVLENRTNIAANATAIAGKQDAFKIDWQKKFLSAPINVDTTDIADLRLNNLEAGKYYRVSMQASFITTSNNAATVVVVHNGSTLMTIQGGTPAEAGSDRHIGGNSTIFKATASTVTFNFIEQTAATLDGTGFANHTWVQLEELPNHKETEKWS